MYLVSLHGIDPAREIRPISLPSIDMARGCAVGLGKALATMEDEAVIEISSDGDLIESASLRFWSRYDYKFAGEDS
jgi:hypothetical protein